MSTSVILFGWTRSVPGREQASGAHFDEFATYLAGCQKDGRITGFDVVLLDPHGGDLNGFFLVRGDRGELDALAATNEWLNHVVRASLHLQGFGAIRGATGEGVGERMALWRDALPS
jgi:hypothetical protein